MAPKPKPWFRVYVEVMRDRKLRRLKPEHRWLWIGVLSAARESPVPGELRLSDGDPVTAEDLADIAALTFRQVKDGLQAFAGSNMITTSEGVITVVAWGARQYESDTSTQRANRSKQRRMERECNDDATLHQASMQRSPSVTENREQRTDPDITTTTTESVGTGPSSPVVGDQDIRAAAVAVGKALAASAADPGAYAAAATRRILTGPDPEDRDRIRAELESGSTPAEVAAGWAPALARVLPHPTVNREPCSDPDCSNGMVIASDGLARRCGSCNSEAVTR